MEQSNDNLKPFNLEKALAGDPVVTRDGKEVCIAQTYPRKIDTPPVVAGGIGGCLHYWFFDGVYSRDSESEKDLFMAPKERTVWVNLYFHTGLEGLPGHPIGGPGYHFDTEAEADKAASLGTYNIPRLGNKAHKITFEE